MSLAARLDFTIDDIEDLRIAVGEASAMVLPSADEGSDLVCRYYMRPGEVSITVTVSQRGPAAARGGRLRLAGAQRADHRHRRPPSENGVFSVTLTMNSTVNV